jgi:hypothetical protein
MRLYSRIVLPLAAFGLMALAAQPHAASAQTLSGISLFSTTSTGAFTADIWNTLGGDPYYNLWVSGSGANGATDATASISTALTVPGVYIFTIEGQPGTNSAFNGMNLFFNGNNNTPLISVFAPLATTAVTPAFAADGQATRTLAGASVAGANTLTTSLGNTVTLTNFRWESSTFSNLDTVSGFTRTPGSGSDNRGTFTLTVTAATPEPSALALVAAAGLPAFGMVVRRRKAAK